MYKKKSLKNGLKIVTCNMPHMESVSLGIWIEAGSRFENKNNNGIAHFLEHLLFKGSKKYSCNSIKQSIEGVGGVLNGFTAEEFCCYLVKLPSKYANLALDILSDMVLNPLLPAEEIEKERGVILEEIKMYKDTPQEYVQQLLDGLLWPGHPLGANITGTVESVSGITRKDFLSFKDKFYTAPNIAVTACGKLQDNHLFDKIENKFNRLAQKGKYKLNIFDKKQTAPRLDIFHKDTEQTHLAMGFHGLKRDHADRFALGILNVILGANMSSRLFSELRERKGLAYEIITSIKFLSDTGAFIIRAGIDNKKVKPALALILRELERIKKESVRESEFRRAKDFYIGQLELTLEDTLNHMLWVGESTVTLDTVYTLNEVKNNINKLSKEDLMRVSQEIFKKTNINLALIGPLSKQEKEFHACLK